MGVDIGECEITGGRASGLAVRIVGQIVANVPPGAVLASCTVRDVVAGPDSRFEDVEAHARLGMSAVPRLLRVIWRDPSRASTAGQETRSGARGEVARLTRREQEVAALVACGPTNHLIANGW